MSYKITEECINCGACEPECLNETIYIGDDWYMIDAEKCKECEGLSDSPKCVKCLSN